MNLKIVENYISPSNCRQIIDVFTNAPVYPQGEKPEEDITHINHFKDYSVCRVRRNTSEWSHVTQLAGLHPMGDRWSYVCISHMQILRYTEGQFFNWHKDIARTENFGTLVITLNDDYDGGNFFINGHIIKSRQGQMISFDDNQNVLHSVEPIYKGTRYSLGVWYGT